MKYIKVCCASLALRVFLIVWGHIQDNYLNVKYTDIDYSVFSDAARYVTQGKSPYLRPTYRYSPVLAWILTPNILWDVNFGKILFSLVDVFNGIIIYKDVRARFGRTAALKAMCLWLFNPITLVVSTRGNAESLITLAVLMTLYFHRRSSYLASGLCLGLATHLKIYPVIYSLVLYTSVSGTTTLWQSLKPDINRFKLVTGFILSLLGLSCLSYFLYGWQFLHETYLYHVTRQDIRHNFSPYFYLLYLFSDQPSAPLVSLAAFIPQLLIVLILSLRYRSGADLSWALFILTFGFVTFNKVVTSQYFLWYLGLLPLSFPELVMSRGKSLRLGVAWLAAQALWLVCAYRLEFLGHNVLLDVWMASLLFFAVNVWIMLEFIKVKSGRVKPKVL